VYEIDDDGDIYLPGSGLSLDPLDLMNAGKILPVASPE